MGWECFFGVANYTTNQLGLKLPLPLFLIYELFVANYTTNQLGLKLAMVFPYQKPPKVANYTTNQLDLKQHFTTNPERFFPCCKLYHKPTRFETAFYNQPREVLPLLQIIPQTNSI